MKKTYALFFLLNCSVWSFGQINTFPYSYDFENETSGSTSCGAAYTMVEAGWLNETTTDDLDWTSHSGGTGSSQTGPSADHTTGTSGQYMYIESTSTTCYGGKTALLYSPYFDFTNLRSATLGFWYHMYGASMGDLSVAFELSIAPGTWIPLPIISNSPVGTTTNSITDNVNAWQYATIDLDAAGLSNLTGASVRFRFSGTTGSSYRSDMAIDDFTLFDNSCPAVSNLTSANVTGTTVDASWTSTAAEFQIEAVPTGGTPTGLGPTISNNSFTVTGLTNNTDYVLYVRAICGSDTSIWQQSNSFTTPCELTAPYSESFDQLNTTPNCWVDDIPSGGEEWKYSTGAGYGASSAGDHTGNGGYYAWIDGSNPNNSGGTAELLSSPLVDISTLTRPSLRFYAFSNNINGLGNNTLSVDLTDFGNAGAVTNLVTQQGNLGNGWYEYVLDLSTFTGPVQVVFGVETNSTGSAFYNDILIDDIEFYDGPTCYPPMGLTATATTSTTADLSWSSSATQWSVEVVPSGSPPTALGTVVNSNSYTATGLMPNTAYDVYVTSICTAGDTSNSAGPYPLRTDCGTSTGDSSSNPIIISSTNYLYRGSTVDCFTNTIGQTSADVWFRFVVNNCATAVNASLCNSSFDTYLHILDANLNILRSNDDNCGVQSLIQNFPVTGGDTIYVVVEGYSTSVGAFELSVDQNASVPVADFHYDASIYCQSFADPSPTINATTGGIFTEASTTMAIDSFTGSIDLDATPAGSYTIKYSISQGSCLDEDSATVVIDPADDASFTYGSTSFCPGDASATPSITGLANGHFSESSGNLALHTRTGEMDIASSPAGTYTVAYTTTGLCPNTATEVITINTPDFNYTEDSYCTDGGRLTPLPDATMGTTPGGRFTSTAGLTIDTATGLIDVLASTMGTYTVTYTVNGCVATDSLTIAEREDASFNYARSTYCANDPSFPMPNITGNSGGAFSSPTFLTVNMSTGQIDLSSATTGVSHTVIYATSGACPSYSSATLHIEPANSTSCYTAVLRDQIANTYKLFPNPNKGQFIIANEGTAAQTSIEVTDLLGQSVYRAEWFMPNGTSQPVDLGKNLSAGTYFARIYNQESYTTIRVSITK